jgi:tetratricopeptide (TPR) repeat protein
MTKRKIQHQLEDLSRFKFGLALPRRWVLRDKDKDYGIDCEVEIFDSKEKATGHVFWAQLKATSSKHEKTIKSLDLSLESIKYYQQLVIPVLIVRYSQFQDVFYVKWTTDIDPFYAKKGAKTMRIKFSESDLLNSEKLLSIEKHLSKLRAITSGALRLPIGLTISFGSETICGIASGVLLTKIRSSLNAYNNILRYETDQEGLCADILIDKDTLRIGFLGIPGCTFHSVALMERSTLPIDLIKDISLGISLAILKFGYCDLAARIIFSSDIHHRLRTKPDLMQSLLPHLLKTSYFEDTLNLVSDMCDEADNNFLETIASTSLILVGDPTQAEKSKAAEAFLKRNAERYKVAVPRLYGIAQYNLGNFYRNTHRLKEAIRCYLVARRYEPKYCEQDYFFGELAGALFEYGKYRNAALIYRRALEFNGDREWVPLYADSLMFSGKYLEALELFDDYLNETNDQTAEWQLKSICLKGLIEKYKITTQARNVKSAMQLADVSKYTDIEREDQLERALEQDLLCGLAWYNLGQLRFKQAKIEDALFCFTICALVQRWDIEAWVNATASSFNKVTPEFFVLLVRGGYAANGDEYIGAFYRLISETNGEDVLSQVSTIVEQVISQEEKSNSIPVIRFLNKDGKFRNIFRG